MIAGVTLMLCGKMKSNKLRLKMKEIGFAFVLIIVLAVLIAVGRLNGE